MKKLGPPIILSIFFAFYIMDEELHTSISILRTKNWVGSVKNLIFLNFG